MQILLLHGRDKADQEMDDWGFQGPTIEGVEAIHYTYNDEPRVWFTDQASFEKAKEITGWDVWDDLALTMRIHDDMVAAGGKFYGDWEPQQTPEEKAAAAMLDALKKCRKALRAHSTAEPETAGLMAELEIRFSTAIAKATGRAS